MRPDLSIAPLAPADIEDIRGRLREVGLMWEDIDRQRSLFWACRREARPIAWIGLELDGANGLLRSLFTDPAYRTRGIGRALVATLEREAVQRGVATMYLFSTGAGRFFESLGYAPVLVQEGVLEIRNTPQGTWYLARPLILAGEVMYRKGL